MREFEREFNEMYERMSHIKKQMDADRYGNGRARISLDGRLIAENNALQAENAELKKAVDSLVLENFLLHTYFDKAMESLFGEGECPCNHCECDDVPIEIESVEYRPRRTIIHFTDGTKSQVKCFKNDTYDARLGFVLALLKKVFGVEQYRDIMRTYVYDNPDYQKAGENRKEWEEKIAQANAETEQPTEEQAEQSAEPIGEPVVTAPEKPVAPSDIPVSAIEQEMAKEDKTFAERGDVQSEEFFDEDDDPLAPSDEA